jgi:hypothetical protein
MQEIAEARQILKISKFGVLSPHHMPQRLSIQEECVTFLFDVDGLWREVSCKGNATHDSTSQSNYDAGRGSGS